MVKRIKEEILKENTIEEIISMIDDAKLDYIDYDQMEEEGIKDEFEYYNEYNNFEAEDSVLNSLVEYACVNLDFNLYDLDTSEWDDLTDWIRTL